MNKAKNISWSNTGIKNFLLLQAAALLMLASVTVHAISVKQCFIEAKTALEISYCKIIEKGQTLPDFYAFQRNPSTTQRLLLSTPARKAGIELPKGEDNLADRNLGRQNAAPTFSKQQSSPAKSVTKPTDLATESTERLPASGQMPAQAAASRPIQDESVFANCQLNKKEIQCPQGRYFLVINLPLKRLNQRVLEDDNRLVFPSRRQSQSHIQYLSALYPNYLEKMLLIGLGDSTMSFTKFAALYEQAQSDSKRFGQRFSEMYELLKKERKTMGIKTRYQDNYPESLDACMPVSEELIACDDIRQNWVYQRLRNY